MMTVLNFPDFSCEVILSTPLYRRDTSRYNREPLWSWGFPKWNKWRGNPPSGSQSPAEGNPPAALIHRNALAH
ncbi:MAG: hypothetical protein RMY31_024045 [Dendronalium sp. ChiSLP03b]